MKSSKSRKKANDPSPPPRTATGGGASPPPRKPKSWLETHGRDLRFLGLFIFFLGIYYFISTTSMVQDRFFPWWLEANARATAWVMGPFPSLEVTRQGKAVTSPGGSITVARGCDAMEPVALFISAVLASPVTLGARAVALLVGTAILLVINLVRIITLFLCAVYWKAAFDFMHLDFWQALFIFLAIFLWAIWAAWAVKRHRRTHVPATA
jgi:exosortase/archaeosortase family protein